MRILLVDHFDSFTRNLASLVSRGGATVDIVPCTTPWHRVRSLIQRRQIDGIVLGPGPGHPSVAADMGISDCILNTFRQWDEYEVKKALRLDCVEPEVPLVPTLGVCLGHQGIATKYGAAVTRAPALRHGRQSTVTVRVDQDQSHSRQSRCGVDVLTALPATFSAIRYNSLTVDASSLPSSFTQLLENETRAATPPAWTQTAPLRVLATSPSLGDSDSDESEHLDVMGLAHVRLPLAGVQFHPESVASQHGDSLIRSFLEQVRSYADRSRGTVTDGDTEGGDTLSGMTQDSQDSAVGVTCVAQRLTGELDLEALAEQLDTVLWLDSSQIRHGFSRYSILVDTRNDSGIDGVPDVLTERTQISDGFFGAIDHSLNRISVREIHAIDCNQTEVSALPFLGGYVGYIGYGMLRQAVHGTRMCDESVELDTSDLTPCLTDRTDGAVSDSDRNRPPPCRLVLAARTLVVDHLSKCSYAVALTASDGVETATAWCARVLSRTATLSQQVPSKPSRTVTDLTDTVVGADRHEYMSRVRRCLSCIARGDSYELCLTTQLKSKTALTYGDGLRLYRRMRRNNSAPHGAFLRFPSLNLEIASCSPERFLQIRQHAETNDQSTEHSNWTQYEEARLETTGALHVECKPIKGTRPRGRTKQDDETQRRALLSSEKDAAENIMIVDLMRHDLSAVCAPGSVRVPRLLRVESYATVHQLVSTVTGVLPAHSPKMAGHVTRQCFPPGSMTGAPKVRTVQLLRRIERQHESDRGGVYSGCLGYFDVRGGADLSVVIRTAVLCGTSVTVGAGGAIVAQSDPDDEWREMTLKAAALLRDIRLTAHSD
ncbi:MAG: hypothetical protein MHM6MM_006986 [Cercozoa sp. M6MM]